MKESPTKYSVSRRIFLGGGAAAGLATILRFEHGPKSVEAKDGTPKSIQIVQFSGAGQPQGVVSVLTIVKSDEDWKKQLPKDSYTVTRLAGTERAYTGKYVDNHEQGLYRCVCCATALFSSATKFESGTGWPSFWQAIAKENVLEISDRSFGVERIAVSCALCDAHLGHVFDDGPQPTGLRYCMNSVALQFVKAA